MALRRLEFKDSRSYKFWEIEVEGSGYTVRYGKVGTDGQVQTKSFASPDKAAADADKKLRSKVAKGYKEVGSQAPAAKPEAASAGGAEWAVRADALQAEGDPWGQRIALWIAREAASGADKRKLTKELDALDQDHAEHFYGPALAKLLGEDGFDKVARLTWDHGYIVRARIGMPEYGFEGPAARDILRAIVAAPAGKRLRELTIGLYDFEGGGLAGVGSDIAAGGELPELERLFIGDFDGEEQEISWVTIGDLSPLWTLTPKLHTLRLHGAGVELGEFVHPTLARLEIETGGLPRAAVVSLAFAILPELAHMEVWFGREEYGGTADIDALRPLFASKTLPKLRHLGLQNAEMQDAIAVALSTAPLLAQVESVDLSMGTLHGPGIAAMLAHASNFAHLKSLNLERNYIPAEQHAALRDAFGAKLRIGSQEAADEYEGQSYYYTTVGE